MVVGKKKNSGLGRIISQSSDDVFEDSSLYCILTSSPSHQVAADVREAIFSNFENVHLTCAETGTTYLHLIADNSAKFSDAMALPAVYMLCYAGIDVSAQDKEENETALHRLVRKPGSHKIILALLRYGIDTSLRNRSGLTAQDYLESEQPPGYQETLHWFNKLSPGLHSLGRAITGNGEKLSLGCVEKLLKGWCKVSIYSGGKPLNLLQVSQMSARDALLAELFKKYYWTNELVHATLAGLTDEMKRIYKEGKKKVDVDTLDHSYQLDMSSPIAPQPLIVAAWEQGNYDTVDQLLLFDVDVCNSYSNKPDTNLPKPLFYQTLLGTPRVTDVNIMLRILQEGDLRCKTEDSTTFLHESVKYSLPAQFVAKLFSLDVPLEERDNMGFTARECALKANKLDLVQVMDDVVIQAARDGDLKRLETIVLQHYEINEVKTANGQRLATLAANKELPSKMVKFVQNIPDMQAHMQNLWNCVYRNDLVQLRKYLSSKDLKRVIYSRNRCGRSILLLAILYKNKEAVRMILKKHHRLVEYFDNNMLTCLHYSYLMFGDDMEIAQLCQAAGASVDWCCSHGMSAYFYQKHIMDEANFAVCQNYVLSLALQIFPDGERFKDSFREACLSGNLTEVCRLADLFRPYDSVSVLTKAYLLFDVIDARHEDVAIFLLKEGSDSSITKQYEHCDLCPMLECFHPSYSLLDRARANQLPNLSNYLVEMSVTSTGPHESQGPVGMEIDPETGMSINVGNGVSANGESVVLLAAQFSEDTRL
ncbi:uncharacterized protein [Watersipora subatra]|uniref:uncharacterized protein n=1 Tax=Watersipora subatra TaxID=2589382 RepID=UPI00355AF39D